MKRSTATGWFPDCGSAWVYLPLAPWWDCASQWRSPHTERGGVKGDWLQVTCWVWPHINTHLIYHTCFFLLFVSCLSCSLFVCSLVHIADWMFEKLQLFGRKINKVYVVETIFQASVWTFAVFWFCHICIVGSSSWRHKRGLCYRVVESIAPHMGFITRCSHIPENNYMVMKNCGYGKFEVSILQPEMFFWQTSSLCLWLSVLSCFLFVTSASGLDHTVCLGG